MKIQDLSAEKVTVTSGTRPSMTVTLDGVSGEDLVACADDDLLSRIIDAAGPELCCEVHGLIPKPIEAITWPNRIGD